MSSAAATADWVRTERRKQNAVILLVILACLLVAFFPRNERRLFAFPGERGMMETIAAPFQTRLREGIFSTTKKPAPARHEMVLPLSLPPLEDFMVFPDPWLGQLLSGSPMAFDYKLPNPVIPEVTDGFDHLLGHQFRPNHFASPIFLAGVPEPGTWAMLIAGIGFITWQIRAVRLRALKRRGHMRWRRMLLPPPRLRSG